jgi:hypothetical protein
MHINVPYNFSGMVQKTVVSDAAVGQKTAKSHAFSAQENAYLIDCFSVSVGHCLPQVNIWRYSHAMYCATHPDVQNENKFSFQNVLYELEQGIYTHCTHLETRESLDTVYTWYIPGIYFYD